jgi:hypothetical protein
MFGGVPVSLPPSTPRGEASLALGAEHEPVDLATRALVAGVVPAPRFAREAELVAAANATADAGADLLDVSLEPTLVGAAARSARRPVVSRVATADEARAAHHAGAQLVLVPPHLLAHVDGETVDGETVDGETEDGDQATAVVVDDLAQIDEARAQARRHRRPLAIDTTHMSGDEALATEAVALAAGCRIVRTTDVRRTRRVVEVVAAILEARR